MNFNYIITAFKAEWLKIKGLGLIYTGIAIAAIIPLIFLVAAFFNDPNPDGTLLQSIYTDLIQSTYTSFGNFFLLIFIIIAATRIAQSDHNNNGWTFLETQPLSKLSIYAGKFLTVVVLSTITIFLYYLFTIISATIINVIFPTEYYTLAIDFSFIFHSFIRLWILSLGIISLQMMLSMIFSGFIWPFIIGFMGFVVNVVAQIRGEVYNFIVYNNVSVGTGISDPNRLNSYFNYTEYLALFWTVVFFIIGYVIYSRKGFKNAFFKSGKTILISLLGLATIVGVYYLLIQPKFTEKLDDKTIVEGKINSIKPTDKVFIYESELMNEIGEAKVIDGKFRWETKEEIPFGSYIIATNNRRKKIYLSTGDYLNFDISIDKNNAEFNQNGTRKAEMEFNRSGSIFDNQFEMMAQAGEYTDDPDKFYKFAIEDWEKDKKKIRNFRSQENIGLSQDFKEYILQIKAVEMLNALHDYQKVTSFTDKKFAIPKEFKSELNEVIKEPKRAVYTNEDYKNFKINQLLPKEGSNNPDSIILSKLDQMPAGLEKDQLLSRQMIKIMKLTNNKEDREKFFTSKVSQISNDKYKNYVAQQLMLINSQQKGATFPQFMVTDVEGKSVELTKLYEGKYIVIDWWATWCGPCKETKPAFEYEAKTYKSSKNVVFVSISVDENKKAWENAIKDDKSNVNHFWLNDKQVMSALNIQGIPRFMIVDPEGKMYNANLARPGESDFSETLSEFAHNKTINLDF